MVNAGSNANQNSDYYGHIDYFVCPHPNPRGIEDERFENWFVSLNHELKILAQIDIYALESRKN